MHGVYRVDMTICKNSKLHILHADGHCVVTVNYAMREMGQMWDAMYPNPYVG